MWGVCWKYILFSSLCRHLYLDCHLELNKWNLNSVDYFAATKSNFLVIRLQDPKSKYLKNVAKMTHYPSRNSNQISIFPPSNHGAFKPQPTPSWNNTSPRLGPDAINRFWASHFFAGYLFPGMHLRNEFFLLNLPSHGNLITFWPSRTLGHPLP